MRWTRARGALILLTSSLIISAWLLPKRHEGRLASSQRLDREGVPLPTMALARLGSTRLRHAGMVLCLAYSPRGDLLASGGMDKLVRLWDAHTGTEVRRFVGHTSKIESLAFSPDGTLLASREADRIVRLWHVDSGRLLEKLEARPCDSLAFSRDGRTLLIDEGGTFQSWDLGERKWLSSYPPAEIKVKCPIASPSGEFLAFTVAPILGLWDVQARAFCCELEGQESCSPEVAALSPDGAILAAADGKGSICLWDARSGRALPRIKTSKGQFWRLIFSRDAKALIGIINRSSIRAWEMARGSELLVLPGGHWMVNDLCVSPDGQTIAAAIDCTIHLGHLDSSRPTYPAANRELLIESSNFTPNGRGLVLKEADGSIGIRDWATGNEQRCWHPHRGSTGLLGSSLPIALSPDGRFLAKAIDEKTICLRDVQANKIVHTFRTAERLSSLDFAPDGEILVSPAFEYSQLLSLRTGEEVTIKGVQFRRLIPLLFSPNGRWLVFQQAFTSQLQYAYLWDRITNRLAYTIKARGEFLLPRAFSPDGRMLAGIDNPKNYLENQLVLWETATGRERLRLPAYGKSFRAITFSPNGRMLALGCADGTIRLWDVATGTYLQCLRSDEGGIRSLAFSVDGRLLVSVSANKTCLVWDCTCPREPTSEGEKISHRDLEELWRELIDADVARTFQAQQALARAGRAAVTFLSEHLKPVISPKAERVQRLIADLDSDSFAVREQAMRQLEQLGDGTEIYLHQSLRQQPSLELRRRVERLLEILGADSPEHLRASRALEVLEWLNTPESRQLLQELADGMPGAWLTREAKAALKRRKAF